MSSDAVVADMMSYLRQQMEIRTLEADFDYDTVAASLNEKVAAIGRLRATVDANPEAVAALGRDFSGQLNDVFVSAVEIATLMYKGGHDAGRTQALRDAADELIRLHRVDRESGNG